MWCFLFSHNSSKLQLLIQIPTLLLQLVQSFFTFLFIQKFSLG
nr:MAG TPA: hypothetical protein [Caudoviricetes sp.]